MRVTGWPYNEEVCKLVRQFGIQPVIVRDCRCEDWPSTPDEIKVKLENILTSHFNKLLGDTKIGPRIDIREDTVFDNVVSFYYDLTLSSQGGEGIHRPASTAAAAEEHPKTTTTGEENPSQKKGKKAALEMPDVLRQEWGEQAEKLWEVAKELGSQRYLCGLCVNGKWETIRKATLQFQEKQDQVTLKHKVQRTR